MRSLDRAKQYAAATVGVDHGIPGTTTPIYATINSSIPVENQIVFRMFTANSLMFLYLLYIYINIKKEFAQWT